MIIQGQHGILLFSTHTIGAALGHGFPNILRIEQQTRSFKLVLMLYLISALIFRTVFSGLLLSNLVTKENGFQLRTLNELEKYPLMVNLPKGSGQEKFVLRSAIAETIKPRIISQAFDYGDPDFLKTILTNVLTQDHVLIESSLNVLDIFQTMDGVFQKDMFYLSPALITFPVGWIFQKIPPL